MNGFVGVFVISVNIWLANLIEILPVIAFWDLKFEDESFHLYNEKKV